VAKNQNSISPFLVNNQLGKLERAEKALGSQSDCSFVTEKLYFSFSFCLVASEPQQTPTVTTCPAKLFVSFQDAR
jgi:hypothetical protein